MKVSLLVDCIFEASKSVFLPGESGKYPGAAKSLLIIEGKEKILVDTGFGEAPDDPRYSKFKMNNVVHRAINQGIANQIRKHGLKPEDITTVINTHLHAAHSGHNKYFKNAKFYISKEEFRFIDKYLSKDPNRDTYVFEFFDKLRDIVEVNQAYSLTENVRIIPTPGHTLGHQSVVVNNNGRTLIYSGDVSPLRENLESRTPMSGYDRDMIRESMDKLLKIQGAKWIFSHDNAQLTLRQAFKPQATSTR